MANIKIGTKVCNNCVHWRCDEGRYGYDKRACKNNDVCTPANRAECAVSHGWKDAVESCQCFEHIREIRNPGEAFVRSLGYDLYTGGKLDGTQIGGAEEPESASSSDDDELSAAESELLEHAREMEAKKAAFKALLELARDGNTEATFKVAQCYENGYGRAADMDKAVYWYKRAAEQGQTDAMLWLGTHFLEDGSLDEKAAFKWFSAASEKGDLDARYMAGNMMFRGQGVAKNVDEAIRIVRSAAVEGHEHAKEWLEALDEKCNEVESELLKAMIEMAEDGDAESQIELVEKYLDGDDLYEVEQDRAEAARWCRIVIDNNEADSDQKGVAAFTLGRILAEGTGVEEDCDEALEYFAMAAEYGNEEAQEVLAGLKRRL